MLREDVHFILCSDEVFTRSIEDTVREYLTNTRNYWLDFSKGLHLPFEFQKEIVRSAQQLSLLISEGKY